ncbi:phosphocarrier protein [Saccharopolyspora antimicrobica]|uniref:Phosphocarrier protein HPr n=2 Tax=Saccharopolyspora TaxID=1835 RepID=A0A1I5EGY6_9PSEU|nr:MULTISPECIES: HPr family phosphocarrier protein [Saccharopolyspora]RKT86813.1 phosphocarrier protein [Saccharopolyspora antimicrobica]SEF61441.1 phosphocarrier protein [Saccharopolyspora kobensis]SFC47061.1 phosphocarrier protein [Saccharopolyspora kobensis]SFO10755.1 phosphocarrier protein [Saccharopolyspora antimicrobica]
MQRRVRIAASVGLHARPAALLAQAAAAQAQPVTVAKVVDGEAGAPVDAASVLGLMSLGARHGEEVELSGPDEAALDELAALLEQDLDKAPA